MLQDSVRMNAYYSAIVNNASDFKDKAQLTIDSIGSGSF
jgi:hypothetical protein